METKQDENEVPDFFKIVTMLGALMLILAFTEKYSDVKEQDDSVPELEKWLQYYESVEDYEQCAILRDKIAGIKNK